MYGSWIAEAVPTATVLAVARLVGGRIGRHVAGRTLVDRERHRIDGEVASGQIVVQVVAEGDGVGAPMVGVGAVVAIRGDLVRLLADVDLDGPEPVLVARAREEPDDLVRACVRGEIPVGGLHAAQEVAHAPAHEVRLVARFAERGRDRANRGRNRSPARVWHDRLRGSRVPVSRTGRAVAAWRGCAAVAAGQFLPRNR